MDRRLNALTPAQLRALQLSRGGRGSAPVDAAPPPDPDPGPPEEEVTAPAEPISPAQLATMLGFGGESIWKLGTLCNEGASPFYPFIGASSFSTTVGTPTYGVDGPSDAFDKAVRFSDGQGAQIGSANGAQQIGANDFAIIAVVKVTSGAPGNNRTIFGHNSTDDAFLQLRTNGHIWAVLAGGGSLTVPGPTIAHNDDLWHVLMFVGINGGNGRVFTDLGAGVETSIAAITSINAAAAWQIGQNNACPAADIALVAVAVSDGTAEEDAGVLALYNNGVAACQNLLTALGGS